MSEKGARPPGARGAGADGAWDELLAGLDRLAAGGVPDPALAASLATDPAARRRLAERDPSAIFSLLSSLPLEAPLPGRPVMPLRQPRSQRSFWRSALAASAVAVGLVALLSLAGAEFGEGPGAVRNLAHHTSQFAVPASGSYYQVVRSIDSPTAEIIVLVPPEVAGPTVTLIVDEEVDL